ncbi:MAG: hypothetical protein ABR958_06405 [Dehalococcoidales bacterium]
MTNEPKKFYQNVGDGKVGINSSLEIVRIIKSFKKNWRLITLTWIVTVLIATMTTFLFKGWLGILIGVVLSVIPFFLGILAIEKVIEKEVHHG